MEHLVKRRSAVYFFSFARFGAQKLEWAFGYDKGVRNGVHSLARNAKNQKAVFLPASNTGVIHIYETAAQKAPRSAKQVLLRGHINRISAVAVSDDSEWIATGDTGQVLSRMLCRLGTLS